MKRGKIMNKTKNIFKIVLILFLITTNIVSASANSTILYGLQLGEPGVGLDKDDIPNRGNKIYGGSDMINPGDVLQLDLILKDFTASKLVSILSRVEFNPEHVELIDNGKGRGFKNFGPPNSDNGFISDEYGATHTIDAGKFNEKFINILVDYVEADYSDLMKPAGEDRFISFFFKVKDDIEPGTQIKFSLPAKNLESGTDAQVFGNLSAQALKVSLINQGEVSIFVSGGTEETEEAKVSNIKVEGNVNSTTYDYFEGLFTEGKHDYRNDEVIVPNAVNKVDLGVTVDNADNLSIITYKTLQNGDRFGVNDNTNLHVGDNYFKTVIKDGDTIVGEYDFKIKRLSNHTDYNFTASANGDTLIPDADKNIKFKYAVTSVNLNATIKEEKITYQGKTYTYTSEAILNYNSVVDVSNTSIDNFPFAVNVTPEDALEKYASVKGNVATANNTQTYHLVRMSNDTSLTSVKLSEVSGSDLGHPSKDGNNYTFNVADEVKNVKLDIVAADGATFTTVPANVSNISLNQASTEITVNVTAEDGTVDSYKVYINKEAKNTNDLAALDVVVKDGTTVKVNKKYEGADLTTNITLDDLEFSNDYTISIDPTLVYGDGSSVISSNIKDVKLETGQNTFEVKVKAENGNEKSYRINVLVKENSSSEIDEGDIGVDNGVDLVDPSNPVDKGDESVDGDFKVYNYTINVNYSQETFGQNDLALEVPKGATAIYDPSIPLLNVGSNNTYNVEITSQDGTSKSRYVFTIVRAPNDQIEVEFDVITTPPAEVTMVGEEYVVKVDSSVQQFELAVRGLEGTIIESGGSGTYPLVKSDHIHEIVAKSQDGSQTKTFKLKFNRTKSSNNELNNMFVTHETLTKTDFMNSFLNSVLNLNVDSSWIEFNPVAKHISSDITINGSSNLTQRFELEFDKTHQFDIVVTPETGNKKTYTVMVKRQASSDAKLNGLKYSTEEGNTPSIPGFSGDTLNYTLEGVLDDSIPSMKFIPEKSDEKSSIEVRNNGVTVGTIAKGENEKSITIPLNFGENKITFIVTAHDGTTRETYEVIVNKELSSNTDIGEEGVTPDGDNDHQIAETSDPYVYNVYVPFGTTTYSKDDFKVDTVDNQTITYEKNSIPLDKNATPNGEFKFTIHPQNSEAASQDYILKITILDGDYPLLDSVKINGKEFATFNNQTLKHTINLDDFITTDNRFVTFESLGNEVKMTISPSMSVVDTLGKAISVHTVVLQNRDNDFKTTYEFTLTKTLSSNADLSDLSVEGSVLSPEFDKDTLTYDVNVGKDVDSINIIATQVDKTSAITGAGSQPVVPGKNVITVKVIAEDGTEKEYTINVYKEVSFDKLELDGRNILDESVADFKKDGNKYVYTVKTSFNPIQVEVFLEAKAHESLTISSPANNSVSLDTQGKIEFSITTRSGEQIPVEIIYTRIASGDNTLKELSLAGKEITLVDDTLIYEVDVSPQFTSVSFSDFEYLANHPKAKVNGAASMNIEHNKDNIYEITVTAEDGSQVVYKIKLTRGSYNFLENLSIEGGQGYFYDSFEKEKRNYDALVYSNIASFSFKWETAEGITVINADELRNIPVSDLDKKTFEIKVQDGENQDIGIYSVSVSKGLSNRLKSLSVSEGILNFKPENTFYDVYVSDDSSSITLSDIIAEDPNAGLSINGTEISDTHEVTLDYQTTSVEILLNNDGSANIYKVNFIKTADQTSIDKITANDGNKIWNSTVNEEDKFEITVDNDTNIEDLYFNVSLDVPGGTVTVTPGENEGEYTITVTDKNGISKDYDLVVKNDLSDNAYLEYLKVNGVMVAGFNRFWNDYSYHVSAGENFDVTAKAEHQDTSNVVISDTSNVKDGDVISITVTSEKGTVNTYKVTASVEKSNTAVLDSLNLKEANIAPKFNKLTSQYYVTVPNELEEVTVDYTFSHGGSVTVNGTSDKVVAILEGENTINVVVTAEDNTTFTYTIHVTRSVQAQNFLDSLSVSNDVTEFTLSPTFNKETTIYTVKVPRALDTVTVEGTFDVALLVNGLGEVTITDDITTHQVKVFENGVMRTYIINIVKEASNDASLEDLVSDVGDLVQVDDLFELKVGNNDTVNLTSTANDKNATVVGDGEINLVPGKNIVTIIVTAEDGITKKEYTVVIIRDASLISVNIGGKDYTVIADTEAGDNFYKLDDKLDTKTVKSKVIPTFNDASVTHSGLEQELTFGSSGSFKFEMITRDGDKTDLVVAYERDKSSDTSLDKLVINNQEIPLIDGVYEYDVEVPFNFEEFIKDNHLNVITGHPNATIVGDAKMDIVAGENNQYKFTVKAEDGTEQEYTINIKRADYDEGPSTLLKSLTVDNGILNFISQNMYYQVKVSKTVDTVTLSDIIPVDANADVSSSLRIENNSMEVTLVEDVTTVKITVTNGGSLTIYTVIFVKVDDQTGIDDFTVNDGENIWQGEFNEEEGRFEVTVDEDTNLEDIEIDINTEFPGSKTEIEGPVTDENGDDSYTITITDENGVEKEYDLVVKKDKSKNAFLESLGVFGEGLLGFNKYTNSYTYTIKDDEVIEVSDIIAVAEHADADVEITIVDNVVSIKVTAANGTENVYTITIEVEEDKVTILESLRLLETGISPKFNKNEAKYYATIPNEMDKVTVVYTSVSDAVVEISANTPVDQDTGVVSDLVVGTNEIKIKVSNGGVSYTYVIVVERSDESTTNILDSLQIVDYENQDKVYPLSSPFDPERLVYSVEVPYDVNSFLVEGEFADNLLVSGLDMLIINDFPYLHKVRVADENGIVREYSITFIKGFSNETYLGDLSVSVGQLDPYFEKDVTEYTVEVDAEVESIDIDYVLGREDQFVTGAGTHSLSVGRNVFEVVVRSGSAKTVYTITVYRVDDLPRLTNLWTSEGGLTPNFNKNHYAYSETVTNDFDEIEIFAESEHEITGAGVKALVEGDNLFEIVASNGDKSLSTYVMVFREFENPEDNEAFYDENVELAHLSLVDELLNEAFASGLLEYTSDLSKDFYRELGVVALPKNPKANVSITGNTDLGNGAHEIKVVVSLENGKSETTIITVTIDQHMLESNIHEIGELYIKTIVEQQKVLDVKNQMLNDNADLKIFKDGEELSDDELVGTGAIIKLVVDNKEYDSKTLIIIGDVNGDGEVSIPDRMQAQSYVLGNELTDIQMIAADATRDGSIEINDVMFIQAHILELQNIFEVEED